MPSRAPTSSSQPPSARADACCSRARPPRRIDVSLSRRRRRAVPGRTGGAARRPSRRLPRPARLGEGPLRRDPRARHTRAATAAADRGQRPGARPPAPLRRGARARRPRRDPVGAVRGDAVGVRRRVVRRARQPADPALGGAVRHGARRGDGGRSTGPRKPSGAIPEVVGDERPALRAGGLGRAGAAPSRRAARASARRTGRARPCPRRPVFARGGRRAPALRL